MSLGFRSVVVMMAALGAMACGEGQKRYVAILTPMNTQVSGNPVGTAEFLIEGNTLTARVDAAGLEETVHPQYIRSGDLCPGASQDLNGDGFVDELEGSETFGGILIPLDSDLSNREAGQPDGFPAFRSYSYQREANLDVLLVDLSENDPEIADRVSALSHGGSTGVSALQALDLNSRTFVIHGVVKALPDTVARGEGEDARRMLPVACGNIVDVE